MNNTQNSGLLFEIDEFVDALEERGYSIEEILDAAYEYIDIASTIPTLSHLRRERGGSDLA